MKKYLESPHSKLGKMKKKCNSMTEKYNIIYNPTVNISTE